MQIAADAVEADLMSLCHVRAILDQNKSCVCKESSGFGAFKSFILSVYGFRRFQWAQTLIIRVGLQSRVPTR